MLTQDPLLASSLILNDLREERRATSILLVDCGLFDKDRTRTGEIAWISCNGKFVAMLHTVLCP